MDSKAIKRSNFSSSLAMFGCFLPRQVLSLFSDKKAHWYHSSYLGSIFFRLLNSNSPLWGTPSYCKVLALSSTLVVKYLYSPILCKSLNFFHFPPTLIYNPFPPLPLFALHPSTLSLVFSWVYNCNVETMCWKSTQHHLL